MALEEAISRIQDDPPAAADLLLGGKATGEGGISRADVIEALQIGSARFGVLPNGTMKYADFMYKLGSIKHRPANWKELFFDNVASREVPGTDASTR